jgi:hypothetical protein
MKIEKLFESLWNKYTLLAPDAKKILDLFQKTQEKPVVNDHIALRTLSDKRYNIAVLSQVFLNLGYEKKEKFDFKEKHLDAVYLQHPNLKNPKVFISELRLKDFDDDVQKFLNDALNKIPEKSLQNEYLVSSGRYWDISYKTYEKLYKKSEYAAWFYVYGFTCNHFTIYINDLEKFDTIEEVNKFVKDHGYKLNISGGEIKGDKEVCLEQSSTLAQVIEVKFTDGKRKIPSCFYEFAIRHKDKNGNLYQSFVKNSANKIFESTNI